MTRGPWARRLLAAVLGVRLVAFLVMTTLAGAEPQLDFSRPG
jgi:hypothetical protein